MFCTKCGNNLPDNAKFCDKCGTLQTRPDISRISSDKEKTVESESGTPTTQKWGKYLFLGIIGIIALVIIIAAVFSYVSMGSDVIANQKNTGPSDGGTLTTPPIPTLTPASDLSAEFIRGTWSGQWSHPGLGINGCYYTDHGTTTWVITSAGGNAFSGSVSFTGMETRKSDTCAMTSTKNSQGEIRGTIRGTTLEGSYNYRFTDSSNYRERTFSATLNGGTITGKINQTDGGTGIGSFTLTKTS